MAVLVFGERQDPVPVGELAAALLTALDRGAGRIHLFSSSLMFKEGNLHPSRSTLAQ